MLKLLSFQQFYLFSIFYSNYFLKTILQMASIFNDKIVGQTNCTCYALAILSKTTSYKKRINFCQVNKNVKNKQT